jgi:hypothetical protein
MSSHHAAVHVTPGPDGRWIVAAEEGDRPLSEHADASAAVRAAARQAARRGDPEVLVHDRYHHIHHHRPAQRSRPRSEKPACACS